MVSKRQQLYNVKDAIRMSGDVKANVDPLDVPDSFEKFFRDIWSQSAEYQNKEWFQEWHIGVVCNDMQWCKETGKNYACMMPRGHLKSTICYGFVVWLILMSELPTSTPFYLSYNHSMAEAHVREIKKNIEANPILNPHFIDTTARSARNAFRYRINSKKSEMSIGGALTFRRGKHTNTALIADDLLKDPTDPVDVSQLEKIERLFFGEYMLVPNEGVPTIVVGTPMAPNDLFYKLREDDRFFFRALPARDPVPNRSILAPSIKSKEFLDNMEKNNPSEFATEMMLAPRLSEDAYITDAELRACEDNSLVSLDVNYEHDLEESVCTTAGFDVGKKRHPSHLSIYISTEEGEVRQVCQMWLDGWSYTSQIDLLNRVLDYFDIDRAYFDNTKGELEERNLKPAWRGVTMQVKNKSSIAQTFESYVCSGNLKMIRNDRQRNQIVCVNVDFKAPETAMGHGESFWSNALALYAMKEMTGGFGQTVTTVGEVSDLVQETVIVNRFVGKPECPNCGHAAGWIPERNKCLICFAESLPDLTYRPPRPGQPVTTHDPSLPSGVHVISDSS